MEAISKQRGQEIQINRKLLLRMSSLLFSSTCNGSDAMAGLVHSHLASMDRVETLLQDITVNNQILKNDITTLTKTYSTTHQNCPGPKNQPGSAKVSTNVTHPAPSTGNIDGRPYNVVASGHKTRSARKAQVPIVQQSAHNPVKTIRIKPVDDNRDINELLSGTNRPTDLNIVNSKILPDGSKVIYTKHEEKFRQFLSTIGTIKVLDKISFMPKIKILQIPRDTDPDIIKTALNSDSARHLRTIQRNGHLNAQMIFEVDPETYKRLVGDRLFLPSLTVCPIVSCEEVPICTFCLRPGHSAQNCKDKANNPDAKQLCAKCGQTDHSAKECHAQVLCCINCKRAGKRDQQHSAFDQRKCPVLRSHAQWRNSNTNYGPSN